MSKAFGEQTPTLGEDAVSWQTWSDGAGGIPNTTVNIDWGKLSLQTAGAEGRSAVYDLGSAATRKFTLTENRYGTGSGVGLLQIRGDTVAFTQDDNVVDWETYTAPVSHAWRYVQVRETTFTYYYMDATLGDDAHPGTKVEPWQTIAKVNGETFLPGDHILFKRGETWSGTALIPHDSGTPGLPITYGNYGSGALPVIIGSATACISNTAVAGKSYLRFIGIDANGNNASNTGFQIGRTNNEVIDCVARNCVLYGIWIAGGATPGVTHDITIHGNVCYNNAAQGIFGNSTGGANSYYNCLVENNICYSNGTAIGHHGIYLSDGYANIIRRNTCYSNYDGGIKLNDQSGVGNGGSLVELNLCYSNASGIYSSAAGNTWKNNLVYDSSANGLFINGGTDSSNFYNNTIVNSYTGINFYDNWTTLTGNVFKNNLVVQDNAVVGDRKCLRLAGDGTANAANNTFDRNLYYGKNIPTGHVITLQTGGDITFATWQAFTGSPDANTLTGDPVLVTEWTNLHLQVTSPCIGAGDATVGVLTDYDGVARGVAVDIGCYEYI